MTFPPVLVFMKMRLTCTMCLSNTTTGSNVGFNAASNAVSNAVSNTESNAESNTKSNAETNTKSNTETNTKSNAETNTTSNPKSNAETNPKSNAESSAESCKCPRRSQQLTKLLPIPDVNNVRFCRVCGDFLPLSKFPTGFRRYTCRVHLYQRTGRKAKKALLMKPRKRLLGRIWAQAYKDCFRLGHTRVLVTQKELDVLLRAYVKDAMEDTMEDAMEDAVEDVKEDTMEDTMEDAVEDTMEDAVEDTMEDVVEDVKENTIENTMEDTMEDTMDDAVPDAEVRMHELAVVPKDPRKLLSVDNAVVVTKERRRELMQEFFAGSRAV